MENEKDALHPIKIFLSGVSDHVFKMAAIM